MIASLIAPQGVRWRGIVFGVRTLAMAQTLPKRGDIDANLQEHIQLIDMAAGAGVELLIFPELSLTGYELRLAAELALSQDDAQLMPLIQRAARYGMTLVVGAPARIDQRLHIGAFILSPDPSVALYTKHHLGAFPPEVSPDGVVPPAEDTVFEPGDRNPLIDIAGDVVALAVCADTGRASHPAQAADRGAQMYLASMFFTPSELEQESAKLRGYALRHCMVVGFANFGGPSGGLASAGSSAIWSTRGELLAQLPGQGSGLAVAMAQEGGWRGRTMMLTALN